MNFNNRLYGTFEKVKLTQLLHNFSTTCVLEEGLLKKQSECQGKNLQTSKSLKEIDISRPWTHSGGSCRHCHQRDGNHGSSVSNSYNDNRLNKGFVSSNNYVRITGTGGSGKNGSDNSKTQNGLTKNATNPNEKSYVVSQAIDSKSPSSETFLRRKPLQKVENPNFGSNINAAVALNKQSVSSVLTNNSNTKAFSVGDSFPAHKIGKTQDVPSQRKYNSQPEESFRKRSSQPSNATSSFPSTKSAFKISEMCRGPDDFDVNNLSGEAPNKIEIKKANQDIRNKSSKLETNIMNQHSIKQQKIGENMFIKTNDTFKKDNRNFTSIEKKGQDVSKNYALEGSPSSQTLTSEQLKGPIDMKSEVKFDKVMEKGTLKEINKTVHLIWPPLYSAKVNDEQLKAQQSTNLKNKICNYSKNVEPKLKTENPPFSMGRVFSAMRKNSPYLNEKDSKMKPTTANRPHSTISKPAFTLKPRFSMTAPTEKEKEKAQPFLRRQCNTSRVSKVNTVVCNPKYFVIQEFLEENKAKLRASIKKFIENKKKELTANLKDDIEDWKKVSALQRRIGETKARLRKSIAKNSLVNQNRKNKGIVKKKVKPSNIASIPITKSTTQDGNKLNPHKLEGNNKKTPSVAPTDVTEIMTRKHRKNILKSMPAKSETSLKTFKDIIKEKEKEKIKEIFEQAVIPVMEKNIETELLSSNKQIDDSTNHIMEDINTFFGQNIDSTSETNDTEKCHPIKSKQTPNIHADNQEHVLKTQNNTIDNHCLDIKSPYTSYPSGCLKKPELLLEHSSQKETSDSTAGKESVRGPKIYIPLRDKISNQPEKPEIEKNNQKIEETPKEKSNEEKPATKEISPNPPNNFAKLNTNNHSFLSNAEQPIKASECSLMSEIKENRGGYMEKISSIEDVSQQQISKPHKEEDIYQKGPKDETRDIKMMQNSESPTSEEYVYSPQTDKIQRSNERSPQNESVGVSKPDLHFLSPLDEEHKLLCEEAKEVQRSNTVVLTYTSLEDGNTLKAAQIIKEKCTKESKDTADTIAKDLVHNMKKGEANINNKPTIEAETSRGSRKEFPVSQPIENDQILSSSNVVNNIKSVKPCRSESFSDAGTKKTLESPLFSSSDNKKSIAAKSTQEIPIVPSSTFLDKNSPKCCINNILEKEQDSTGTFSPTTRIEVQEVNSRSKEFKKDLGNSQKKYPKNFCNMVLSATVLTEKPADDGTNRTFLTKNKKLPKQPSESRLSEIRDSSIYNFLSHLFESKQKRQETGTTFKSNFPEPSTNENNKESKINVNRNCSDTELHYSNKSLRLFLSNTKKISNEINEEVVSIGPKQSESKARFFRLFSVICDLTNNIKESMFPKITLIEANTQQNMVSLNSHFDGQKISQSVGMQKNTTGEEKISVRNEKNRNVEEKTEFDPLERTVFKRSAIGKEPQLNERRDIGENHTTTRHIVEENFGQYQAIGEMKNDETSETFANINTKNPKTIVNFQKNNFTKEKLDPNKIFLNGLSLKHCDTVTDLSKNSGMKKYPRVTNKESDLNDYSFSKLLKYKSTSDQNDWIQNILKKGPPSSSISLNDRSKAFEELAKLGEILENKATLCNSRSLDTSKGDRTVAKEPLVQALKNLCLQYDGAIGNYKYKNQTLSTKPELYVETRCSRQTPAIIQELKRSKSTYFDPANACSFAELRTERNPIKDGIKVNSNEKKIKQKWKTDKFGNLQDRTRSNLKQEKFTFTRKKKNDLKSKLKPKAIKELRIKKRENSQIISDLFTTKDCLLGLLQWDESINRRSNLTPESFWNSESKDYSTDDVLSYIRRKT